MQFTPAEVTLDSLDQKTSAPMRAPGKLDHAINVTYDKTGAIGKRLGYQRVDLSNTVSTFNDDEIWCAVTAFAGELVIFSYDHVAALGSRDSDLRGADAVVYRGPNNRGACKLEHIGTSQLAQTAEDEPA